MRAAEIITGDFRFRKQFDSPRAFSREALGEVAQALLSRFSQYHIQPSNVVLREGDRLFDYSLVAQLFEGGAKIEVTAEGLNCHFRNARGEKSVEVIMEVMIALSDVLDDSAFSKQHFEHLSHVKLVAEGDAQVVLDEITSKKDSLVTRAVTFEIPRDGFRSATMLVELSEGYPNALFIFWTIEGFPAEYAEPFNVIADFLTKLGLSLGYVKNE